MNEDRLREECREVVSGLRLRAADCRKLAREARLTERARLNEKASAYDHAADLLQDTLARVQAREVPPKPESSPDETEWEIQIMVYGADGYPISSFPQKNGGVSYPSRGNGGWEPFGFQKMPDETHAIAWRRRKAP